MSLAQKAYFPDFKVGATIGSARTFRHAWLRMRFIGLAHSAEERLARFLLDWCAERENTNGEIRAKLTLTHQEIAEVVGMSRETVTQLFADFKKNGLVQLEDSALVVRNRKDLEEFHDSGD